MIDQKEQTYVVVECRALFATIRGLQQSSATGGAVKPHGPAEEVQFGLNQGLQYGWPTDLQQQSDAISVDLQMPHPYSMEGFRTARANKALPGATAGGVVGDPFNTVCGAPRRDEHGRWIRPLPQPQWQQQPLSQVQEQLKKREQATVQPAATIPGQRAPEMSSNKLTNNHSAQPNPKVDAATLQEIAAALESALNASCEATFNRIARERTSAFTLRQSAAAAFKDPEHPAVSVEPVTEVQCTDVCTASYNPTSEIAGAITIEDEGGLPTSNEDEPEFHFDVDGNLCSFILAGLRWNTDDGFVWSAQANDRQYRMKGRVTLESDGTLQFHNNSVATAANLDETQEVAISASAAAITSAALQPAATAAATAPATLETAATTPILGACAQAQHFASPMTYVSSEPTISVAVSVLPSPAASAAGVDHQTPQSISRRRLRTLEHYTRPRQVSIVSRVSRATANWYAEASIKIIGAVFGKSDRRLIRHIDALAFLRQKERQIDEAQRLHWRALDLREHHYGINHRERAINLEALAKMYCERGHNQEAAALLEEAVSMRELATGNERDLLDLLSAINALAQLYAEQETYSLSEKQFQHALDLWNSMTVTPTPQLCELMHRMLRDYRSVLFSANKVHEARSLDGQTYWLRRFASGKRGTR